MRNFSQKEIETIRFGSGLFHLALEKTSLQMDFTYVSKVLSWVAESIFYRNDEEQFLNFLVRYTKRFTEDRF